MAVLAPLQQNTKLLPGGVELHPLRPHQDARGDFTEVFRQSWTSGITPLQWNVVRSAANVLRGFHLHLRHADYLLMLAGGMRLCLLDMRPEAPTRGLTAALDLDAKEPMGVVIPPGVAHGFYFARPSMHLYSVSHYWSHADELACRWDDPEMELDWGGAVSPIISDKDAKAGTLHAMEMDYLQRRLSSEVYALAKAP